MKTYIISGWILFEDLQADTPPDYQTSVIAKSKEDAEIKANAYWTEQGINIGGVVIE